MATLHGSLANPPYVDSACGLTLTAAHKLYEIITTFFYCVSLHEKRGVGFSGII